MFNSRNRNTGLMILGLVVFCMLSYATYSMSTTGALLSNPNPQFFRNAGAGNNMQACSGCLLYFYQAGSSNAQSTYFTSVILPGNENPNPITLNSRGESSTPIWLNGTYKIVLKTPTGSTIWTQDNVTGIGGGSGGGSSTSSAWIDTNLVPTFGTANTFTFPGDQTATMVTNQRLRFTLTAGSHFGRVTASSYALGITTVNVVMDQGALNSTLTGVEYSIMKPDTGMSLTYQHIDRGTGLDTAGANINGPANISGGANIRGNVGSFNVVGSVKASGNMTVGGYLNVPDAAHVNIAGAPNGLAVLDSTGSWNSPVNSLTFLNEQSNVSNGTGTYNGPCVNYTGLNVGDKIFTHVSMTENTAGSPNGSYYLYVTDAGGVEIVYPDYNNVLYLPFSIRANETIYANVTSIGTINKAGSANLCLLKSGAANGVTSKIYTFFMKKN